MHHIEFAVSAVERGWTPHDLVLHSSRYNHPFSIAPVSKHEGDLPAEDELLALTEGSAVMSAVKLAEDGSGSVILRVYEVDGTDGRVTIRLGFPAKSASFVDVTEEPAESAVEIENGQLHFTLGANQMRTIRIER